MVSVGARFAFVWLFGRKPGTKLAMTHMGATTTLHLLALNNYSTIINTKEIQEEALSVRDAAIRPQQWKTLAQFNLLQGGFHICFQRRHSLTWSLDPLYDPPPTPDMTLIESFKSTNFATLLGQNIADPDTRPRKRRRLDKDTIHHIIPDVRA